MFTEYLLKEVKWDLIPKEKAEIEEGWCTSSSAFLPLPWAESATQQRLLPTVTTSLSVGTASSCGRLLLPRMFFTSYLQDHKTIALCGTVTLHRSTQSQNHCCGLNLQLLVTFGVSMIGFLLVLGHITTSVCFCYLISMIHQLQQKHLNSFWQVELPETQQCYHFLCLLLSTDTKRLLFLEGKN